MKLFKHAPKEQKSKNASLRKEEKKKRKAPEKSQRKKHPIFHSLLYRNSLLNKLVLNTTIVIVLAFLCSMFITYLITVRSVSEDFKKSSLQILNQNKSYVELINDNIENSSNLIYGNPEITSLLSQTYTDPVKRDQVKLKIRSELSNIAFNTLSGIIKNIYIFNNNGLSVSSDGTLIQEENLRAIKKTSWYKKAIKKNSVSFWTSPYIDSFTHSGSHILSHVLLLKDYKTGKSVGVMAINIFPQVLNAALADATLGEKGYIFVIDQDNYIISHEKNELVGQVLKKDFVTELIEKEQGDIFFTEDGVDMFGVYTTSDEIGWKFIAVVPKDELSKSARTVGIFSAIIIVLFIFVSIILSFLNSLQVTQPITEIIDITKEISKGNYEVKAKKYKIREVDQLGSNFNTMGAILKEVMRKLDNQIELVNADLRLAHEDLKAKHELVQEKQALIERELNFAQNVQQRLLPSPPEDLPVDLAQQMYVATAVGGDFYCLKYFNMRLSLAIGDVSGHGVPSALVMVLMRDAFMNFSDHKRDPAQVLQMMNQRAIHEIEPGMFTTFFYAEIHCLTNEMKYCNGGHNNPLLFHENKIYKLDSPGLILGVDVNAKYESKKIKVHPGDILFLYTDGLTEMRNVTEGKDRSEMLGLKPILMIIQKNMDKSADEITKLIDECIRDFGDEPPYEDDVTFVCLKL